jgi:hypothetical protein
MLSCGTVSMPALQLENRDMMEFERGDPVGMRSA